MGRDEIKPIEFDIGDADERRLVLEYYDEHAGLPLEQALELLRRYGGDRKKLAEEAQRLKQNSLN